MTSRATDGELEILEPILGALLELLDPHIMAPTFRRALDHGAHIRTIVVPAVDVDAIALARLVRDYGASQSLYARVHRTLANRPNAVLSVDQLANALALGATDRKPLYNALGGLLRRGRIEQVSYGRYRALARPSARTAGHGQ